MIRQTSGPPYNDIKKRDTELFAVGGPVISAAEEATMHLLEAMTAIDLRPKVTLDKPQTLTSKT